MNRRAWARWLAAYNEELLSDDANVEGVSRTASRQRWLGYGAASAASISAKEKQLGVRLPPSYREFLSTTNGWRSLGPCSVFGGPLLPVARLRWFRRQNQSWINTYQADAMPVSMKAHRQYGERQDCVVFDADLLSHCLQVGEVVDSVYLLCPRVRTKGEWEAWHFANWLPGAVRYRSFAGLMRAERRNLTQLMAD